MTRAVRWLSCALLLCAVFAAESKASTINSASCSRTDVGNAVAQAVAGDTVVIPPCAQTNWSTTLTVTKCINIQGSGQLATTLGDNVPKDGTDTSPLITFTVNCPAGSLSLSNMGIVGVAPDPSIFNKGHIRILGTMGFFRIHHITNTTPQTSFATTDTPSRGLFDHLTFPNCTPSGQGALNFKASGWGGASFGDGSWSAPVTPGDPAQIYIEDSSWNCIDPTFIMNAVDGDAGARFVFRFNKLAGAGTVSHGTDSSLRERSVRWQEIYQNTYAYPATQSPDSVNWTRGGSSVVWGNTVTAPQLTFLVKTENLRDTTAYAPWGQCDGSSSFDQDTTGQNGYRCVDQPGSGTSNAISGATPPPAPVGNSLFPIYIFLNTFNGSPKNDASNSSANHVQENRDYYSLTSTFSGVTGVGSGPVASRPTTCTTGVGFWATDEASWWAGHPNSSGQLYKCTATNTWTLSYTPFTYPHPLQFSSPAPPAPPPKLRAVVK